MNTATLSRQSSQTPIWLKIVSVIGVIWYAFGLLQFWMGYSMDPAAVAAAGEISAGHAAAISQTPGLIWLSFAIASAAGLVGSLLLFKRSRTAVTVFTISLIAGVIYYVWVYGLSGTGSARPSEEIIIMLVVLGVTLGFNVLSRKQT